MYVKTFANKICKGEYNDNDHDGHHDYDYDDYDDYDDHYDDQNYIVFTALEYKHRAWAAVGKDEELVELFLMCLSKFKDIFV